MTVQLPLSEEMCKRLQNFKNVYKRSSQLRILLNQQLINKNFFSGLISTTSSVVFLAARISSIRFFSAVQIYEFHISKIIIHHLDGLFGPNILTSSQLACQLSWQKAAPVSQRPWIQIPYGPEKIFSALISTSSSVVFLAARISYIRFFTAVQIYESYISKIITLKTCFETGAQPHTAKSSFAKSAHIFKKPLVIETHLMVDSSVSLFCWFFCNSKHTTFIL